MEKLNLDQSQESQSEVQEESSKSAAHEKTFASGLIGKARKAIGLAGVLGLGYFGGMQESESKSAGYHETDREPQVALAVEQAEFEDVSFASAAELEKAEHWAIKYTDLKSDDSEGKLLKHSHESFDIEGKQPLVAEDDFRLYSMKNEKGEISYVARDERHGESFYIDAVNPEVAETIGRYFYHTNPLTKHQFKKAMDRERELNDAGLIEPDAYKDIKWP